MAEQTLREKIVAVIGDGYDAPYVDANYGRDEIVIDGRISVEKLKQLAELLDKELPHG